ncbi:MAG: class I SAM-dependent methyltransferase [Nitrospirae bacterium]|nr:class I SAM-dependent methyltransferase [Nitrospirota bacterium]MBF0540253.1 class I SAM-dependent methyltransferase [Nitrospirota bacterium]
MKNLIKVMSFNTFIPIFYPALMLPLRTFRKKAIGMLNFKAGDKVLIPGVGTGHDLPFIPEDVEVEGIDISDVMLGIGKVKLKALSPNRKINFVKMDAEKMEYKDATFDKAVLSLFLTVVFDPKAAMTEIVRVMKPGAEILVYDHLLSKNTVTSAISKPIDSVLSYGFTNPARTLEDCIDGLPLSVIKTLPGDPVGFMKGYLLIRS